MSFPPPRIETAPRVPRSQELVEMMYSKAGDERAFITKDAAGLFRVFSEHWNIFTEDPADCYWCRNGPSHFTDDLVIARASAALMVAEDVRGITDGEKDLLDARLTACRENFVE